MQVNIELPEDVSRALQQKWGDIPKRLVLIVGTVLLGAERRSRAASSTERRSI